MAREYRLLDTPGAGRELEKYTKLVRSVRVGDLDYLWDGRWDEFEHSREFRAFATRDKALAQRTLASILDEERPWLIGEDGDIDNLLQMPGARFKIESTLDDVMILSGVRGWEIAQELIDENGRTKKLLGTLALDDYVNLAAAAALYGDNSNGEADLSYVVADTPGTIVRQTVGGTFHGDFAAGWKRFATSGPSIDPTGVRRSFAPALGANFVRAYHSVEDTLAVGMLTYLAAGDAEKLEATKKALVDAIDAADLGRGGGAFADFGSNSMGYASEIFADDFREYHPEEVLESFTVIPGDRSIAMRLVAARDGVVLRNVSFTEQPDDSVQTEVLGEMPISAQEIPQFIATMAAASAGRTSLAEIRHAIEKARVWGR